MLVKFSEANYSKQPIDPLFDGLHRRTYQYVHRCIRKTPWSTFSKIQITLFSCQTIERTL